MTPLIDADILLYEVGSCGQYIEDDELKYNNFEAVADHLDGKIAEICKNVEANRPPILFITNTEGLQNKLNRRAAKEGRPDKDFVPNFRYEVATVKPYKLMRKEVVKPFHYHNLITYMLATYDVRVASGMEADDLLGITQTAGEDTIICSRDKDLRMIPGWQYSWECGKQPEFGPELVDDFGYIKVGEDKKVRGVGLKFFFAQMLIGDSVDNIPGLEGCGDKGAYKLLDGCTTESECVLVLREAYKKKYAEKASERLQEQAKLLWIAREIKDGEVVPYKPKG